MALLFYGMSQVVYEFNLGMDLTISCHYEFNFLGNYPVSICVHLVRWPLCSLSKEYRKKKLKLGMEVVYIIIAYNFDSNVKGSENDAKDMV